VTGTKPLQVHYYLSYRAQQLGHDVTVHDPLADPAEAEHEYGLSLDGNALAGRYDCVVGAVAHDAYCALGAAERGAAVVQGGLVVDLKKLWQLHGAGAPTFTCWSI
jgi:UDP-N-acetyl-D-glucosamine/UDP-N-acetyl-D-galactosamine dehydrogenase